MSGGNFVNPRHRNSGGAADPDKEPFLKETDSLNTPPRRRVLPASSSIDDDRRQSVPAGRYSRLPPAESSSKKVKGIWNWNPIRALSHFGHRRFDCRFSLHIHSIQGLPPNLGGASLAVRLRRISEPAASAQSTRPAQVVQGAAEFKETLYYRCSVYGARSGPAGSAKYEPRQFVISTTIAGGAATEVQLGRHLVDFALLLPQNLDELQEADYEGGSKWTKTFRLSGKAKGASLRISFGFSLVGDSLPESERSSKLEDSTTDEFNAKFEALNSDEVTELAEQGSIIQESCIDRSLDGDEESAEDKHCLSPQQSFDQVELMAIEREIKLISRHQLSESNTDLEQEDPAIDIMQTEELTKIDAKFSTGSMKKDQLQISGSFSFRGMKEPELINKQSMRTEELINTDANKSSLKSDRFPILSFSSFSYHEMKELELFDNQSMQTEELIKKTISSFGSFSFHQKQSKKIEESINADASESLKSSPLISDEIRHSAIREFLNLLALEQNPLESSSSHILESPREQLLKEFEQEFMSTYGDYSIFGIRTETKESDLPGDAFDNIDHSSNVQGVKVDLQLEDAETEALMRQSGLNEKVFQFSSSQRKYQLGSLPIDGKTLQQIAWEATPALEGDKRHLANHKYPDSQVSSSENYSITSLDEIEALSIEGLRIQADMPYEEPPSTIRPQPTTTISASEDKLSQTISLLGLEGTAGLKILDIKDEEVIDGPMGLCITLDEMNKQTLKILAAHQLNTIACKQGHKKYGKGFMGNKFTVALMVQLRDPLRVFEPVGTPMLALVPVERVFVTLKPKLYSIAEKGNSEQEDATEYESKRIVAKEANDDEEEVIPRFKITEIHVAGLQTEPSKRNVWGNAMHQQSGSRWLLAAGMGKSNKHPLMRSRAKSKELAAPNPHIRNSNIIFPNQTIRL